MAHLPKEFIIEYLKAYAQRTGEILSRTTSFEQDMVILFVKAPSSVNLVHGPMH